MPIVTTGIVWDQAQAVGQRYIRESHTDHVGARHVRDYVAAAGFDVPATFPATVVRLNAQLKEWEARRNVQLILQDGDLATPTLVHVTVAEMGPFIREAYRLGTREQSFALGAYLDTRTDAQLAVLFGYSNPSAALTSLRQKVGVKRTQWHDYLEAVGE